IVLMKNSVNNLLDLLENLLTWSRSQRNTITFEPDSVLLKYIVETSISQTTSFADKKNINIISNIPDNIFVFADFNMINTVLRNLINNSVKFSYENGKIFIDIIEKENLDNSISKSNYIIISVKDNGVGIEEKDIDKLFRLDVNHTTLGTSKEKGTGLGLILCKEFVERHNGQIWVESKINEGSTFYFTLLKT
nr:HAMP domain-containing sensor histidine kinase [Candidatus Kapabacteria bacterium]